ncbi:hypothetical protein KQCUZIGB_CDS0014 [Pectobacterium phage Ymer]|uniref:Uncharacterized protein n=2 Tax=unclassified Caudoviricetes TaxID=2788787 RepID=A0AB39AC02_9CAUD|nr:hypothetical protein Abuela_15 [Pectobacterium phage Abuela]WCD42830.1 baseplate assembly protein [Pectobacterium phage Ymer]
MKSLSQIAYTVGGMKVGQSIPIPRGKMINLNLQIGSSISSEPEGVKHQFKDGKVFMYDRNDELKRIR